MRTIEFELTTPERIVERRTVGGITLPTQEGEITVLPGHVPLVANLVPGMVTLHSDGGEEYLAVSRGFIEVQPEGRVVVLADTADRAEELDMEKVERARELARQILEEKRQIDDVAAAAAMAALEREMARIRVARKYRGSSRQIPPPSAE